MADFTSLLQQAAVIRDASQEKENTALRVGSMFIDILQRLASELPPKLIDASVISSNVADGKMTVTFNLVAQNGDTSTKDIVIPAASADSPGLMQPSDKKAIQGKAEAFTISDDLSMSAARELGLSANLKPGIISSAAEASLKAAAEAAGAVYNEATGFFELNSLTDITTEQMAKILYSPPVLISGHYQVPVGVRTNIAADEPASFWNGGNDILNLQDIAVNAGNLEVLKLANESKVLFCSSIAHIARGAVKLRKIMGAIRNGAGSNFFTTNAFAQCAALEEVRVHTLNFNVSFSDSPKLSLASLQYMVTNGANNATPITVTVHSTVYAKLTDTANAEWHAVLTAAAAKKISFATTA